MAPSLRTLNTTIYMQSPPSLEEHTRPNLDKMVKDLVGEGDELTVIDRIVPVTIQLKIVYKTQGTL